MDIHKNARLTPHGRERIVWLLQNGHSVAEVVEMLGVSDKTVRKWRDRHSPKARPGCRIAAHDRTACTDRRRRPLLIASRPFVVSAWTGQAIAAETGVSAATVSRILKRLGLNRLSALEPAEPPRRYQRDRPGELLHIDIKKLGKFNKIGHRITGDRTGQSNNRGVGWEFVHVCIDDASRIAFSRVMKTERKGCAITFLKAAVAYYANLGITVERVMTDNGSCYKAFAFRRACKRLGLRHIRTRPYTPQTNGKAERFIQTALREWAYARAYDTSRQRAAELTLTGCIDTTGTGLMAVSDPCHPSANSALPGITC